MRLIRDFNFRGKASMLLTRAFLLGVLVFAFTACRPVYVQHASFSSLTSLNHGDTFYVLPSNAQATSSQFSYYAASIAQRLSNKGWHRVSNPDDAKYIVLLDYGVSGSSTHIRSSPVYGQTGGGFKSHSGSVDVWSNYGGHDSYWYSGTSYSSPTYSVVGTQTRSVTEHHRYFLVKVIDTTNNAPVYEAQSLSTGAAATFGRVAECMFDAALENFPIQTSGNKIGIQCGVQ